MKLYKYKSLQNFEHVADMICNNRLYTSQYFELNDPMEGRFDHSPNVKKEYLENIKAGKGRLRIHSLSRDHENILLWAHYADSFKGICIELDIETRATNFDLSSVNYSEFNVYVSDDENERRNAHSYTKAILKGKNEVWRYEREVRLLSENKYITDSFKIKSILFGVRTSQVMKDVIARISSDSIDLYDTKISDNRIVKSRYVRQFYNER